MANRKYYYAVGRRKKSTAVVKLYPKGSGKFTIRKGDEYISFEEYFGGLSYMIENSFYPFAIMGKKVKETYDAEIVVKGGGLMGHSESIRLGFARALVVQNESSRLQLKPYGLLKRDPRVKERKKPGLKKARKSPQWSKR